LVLEGICWMSVSWSNFSNISPILSSSIYSLTVSRLSRVLTNLSTLALSAPREIWHSKAKFLTIPIFPPSGVSAGQIIPQWVLCSCLGLAILVEAFIGALTRLRWLKVAKREVSLLRTYDTPYLAISPVLVLPQLPVASAFLRELVIMSASNRDFILMLSVFLLFTFLSNYSLPLLLNSLNLSLKREVNKAPHMSSLFLP